MEGNKKNGRLSFNSMFAKLLCWQHFEHRPHPLALLSLYIFFSVWKHEHIRIV